MPRARSSAVRSHVVCGSERRDLVTGLFATGYAENGSVPVPLRAKATMRVLHESTAPAVWIFEAGRKEGSRAAREKAHDGLYAFHVAELAAGLNAILQRLDAGEVAARLLDEARAHAGAQTDPVARRRALKGTALTAITAQVHGTDRSDLDALNAAGWAHATAHGQAEAQATPAKGGPPDMSKVAAGAAIALKAIPDSTAADASAAWLDTQLSTIAMGAALAAGDGSALGDATRQVTKALLDSGRATRAYTDQLHQAVNAAFVQSIQAQTPESQFDFVNGGPDPCDDCIEDALESPYDADDLPDCPEHPGCLCNIEQAAPVMAAASA